MSVADNLSVATLPQRARHGFIRKTEQHAVGTMVEELSVKVSSLYQPANSSVEGTCRNWCLASG